MGYLRLEKSWEKIPAPKATLLLLHVDVCVKKIFKLEKQFPWPRPPNCPRCHGRIWGHGFVAAYFDELGRQALFLRRYRCPDCRLTLRLRPLSHWPRFQASIATILSCLSHRLRYSGWSAGLSRQRQGHWLRSLIRQVRWHLGVGWKGDLLEGLKRLWRRGVVPVSRSI